MGTVILADVTELETVKISELPVTSAAGDAASMPIVSIGKTKKIAKSNLLKELLSSCDRTARVSPSFVDNEDSHQFSTIQAAINWIHASTWYADLGNEQQAAIIVFPGEYKEQLTCWNYIKIISATDKDNQGDRKTVQIKPPDDKKTEAILVSGASYVYNFTGLTLTADSTEKGPYAKAINGRFYNCRFNNGAFEDGSATYACGLLLVGATFNGTKSIYYTGARGHADRSLYMYDSWGYADIVIESTFATGSPYVEIMNCHFKAKVSVAGDWSIQLLKSRMRNFSGSPNRNNFDTTGDIAIVSSKLSGGLHFVSDPGSLFIEHCDFNEMNATAITGADITADVAITGVDYVHNVQQNGIAGEVQFDCPIKPVGCQAINRYYSLQDAIDSIGTTGVVELSESLTGLAELIIPTGISVTIDGRKLYSLSFTGDIVETKANESIVFYGLSQLNGSNIEVNGDSAYVGFEECLTVNAYATLTSGTNSYFLVYSSTVKAPTGHPAITQSAITSTVVSGYSRIDGGVGHPAILTTVEADSGIKAKFSTLIHGDGAGNSPLVYTGANKMDILVYNCALNAAWSAAKYTNLIGSPNNTTSPEIDF